MASTKKTQDVNSEQEIKESIIALSGIKNDSKPQVQSINELIDYIANIISQTNLKQSSSMLLFLATEIEKISEEYNDELLQICKHFINKVYDKHTATTKELTVYGFIRQCEKQIKYLSIPHQIIPICIKYFIIIDYTHHAESILNISRLTAELYQVEEEWMNAANVLAKIDIKDECFQTIMHIATQCEWIIETTEFCLQINNYQQAKMHMTECQRLLEKMLSDDYTVKMLKLRAKSCTARIYDGHEEWLKACRIYTEIAYLNVNDWPPYSVNPADLLTSLEKAIRCGINATDSDEKKDLLGILYADERAKNLSCFNELKNAYFGSLRTD